MNDFKNKSIPGDLLASEEFSHRMLADISEEILASVEDRTHQFENYQYSSFRYYILLLQQRYRNDPERQYASLLLAALLNRGLRNDFYICNVYAHGDVYPESASNLELNEALYDRFLSDLTRYVRQSAEEMGDAAIWKANWGVYFFTEYLMTELFYRQGMAILDDSAVFREWFPEEKESDPHRLSDERKIELLEEFYMDCGGLFPLIDEDSSEIRSWMPLINTPQYCFAFLYIPRQVAENFQPNIPGYLHEICHYIPPVSRRSRNEAAIRLLACAVTTDWRNRLYRELDAAGFSQEQSHELCYFYIENTQRLFQNSVRQLAGSDFILCEDSLMLMEAMVCSLLDLSDDFFEKGLWGVNPDLSAYRDEERETILSVLDRLRKEPRPSRETGEFQREHTVRFAATFNNLLREIRSDIHMTVLLEIGLKDYFRLMAEEVRFADENVSIVGDYQIFRLGLIARFLWQLGKADGAGFRFQEIASEQELQDWETDSFGALDELEKSYENDGERRKHVLNLREYLKEYVTISVETEPGYDTPLYRSLLEHELSKEINSWYSCSLQMKDCKSIGKLRDLYHSSSARSVFDEMTQTALTEMQKWNVSWPLAPDEKQK